MGSHNTIICDNMDLAQGNIGFDEASCGKGQNTRSMGLFEMPQNIGMTYLDGVSAAYHLLINQSEVISPTVQCGSNLDPLIANKNRLLSFEAKDSQFNLGDSTLIEKWKHRARNNQKGLEHKAKMSGLGKKKLARDYGKISVDSKKQRFVSSFKDSTNAFVEEESAG